MWCSSLQLYNKSPPSFPLRTHFSPVASHYTEGDAASTESTIPVLFSAMTAEIWNPQSSFILTSGVHRCVCPPTPSAVFPSHTLPHKHPVITSESDSECVSAFFRRCINIKPFAAAYCLISGGCPEFSSPDASGLHQRNITRQLWKMCNLYSAPVFVVPWENPNSFHDRCNQIVCCRCLTCCVLPMPLL